MRIDRSLGMTVHRNLRINDEGLGKALERLSSGMRINRAADDAAGLSISENLRSQVRGLAQAERNAQDGISLLNVAEGALNEIHSILQRIRELTVQSANGTLTNNDRAGIQLEVNALIKEMHNISRNTKFNGMGVLDGTFDTTYGGAAIEFQVGANEGQTLSFEIDAVNVTRSNPSPDAWRIGNDSNADGELDQFANISTSQAAAQAWLADTGFFVWDDMIRQVSAMRGKLGAMTNRLEHTINNIAISRENLAAAESRIRDTDMAAEMSNLTRKQILTQASTAMLAQANTKSRNLLQLFQ